MVTPEKPCSGGAPHPQKTGRGVGEAQGGGGGGTHTFSNKKKHPEENSKGCGLRNRNRTRPGNRSNSLAVILLATKLRIIEHNYYQHIIVIFYYIYKLQTR